MEQRLIVNVVDDLNSTSPVDALSANMGRLLNESKLGVVEYTHGNRTMTLHLSNGLLIQVGNTLITPTEPNTRTTKTITFPKGYTELPFVLVSLATAYPSVAKASCSTNTTTEATFVLDRDTVSETAVRWLAIGYKKVA